MSGPTCVKLGTNTGPPQEENTVPLLAEEVCEPFNRLVDRFEVLVVSLEELAVEDSSCCRLPTPWIAAATVLTPTIALVRFFS